ADKQAPYLPVIETKKKKNQRRQNPCGEFTLQARALRCRWWLSQSRSGRGRGRHRTRGSLFGNYIIPGYLVRSKVINKLTLNRRFAVVSLSILQKQVTFLRGQREQLIGLIHERAKLFFEQPRHRV